MFRDEHPRTHIDWCITAVDWFPRGGRGGRAAAEASADTALLSSRGSNFQNDLRTALARELPGQLELYEQWLTPTRLSAPEQDTAFLDYLRALFANHPLDLVISLGGPAANFLQQYHQSPFATTPELLADVEARRVGPEDPRSQRAVAAVSINLRVLVENVLRVLPHTRHFFVVIGNAPNESYWASQIQDALQPFGSRLDVHFLNDQPFDALLRRVGSLPSHSAILFASLSPTARGIPQDPNVALEKLDTAADAPLFSYTDAYLGRGIVGGPLISSEQYSRAMTDAAVRILRGEAASAIKTPAVTFGVPQYDWRELKRWHISRSVLPPGSLVRFAERSVWAQYRWLIISVAIVVLLQSLLIFDLLYERRRRHEAEGVCSPTPG